MILDASAILAYLGKEPGWDLVEQALMASSPRASAVNLAEVLTKLSDKGMPEDVARSVVASLDIHLIPFGLPEAALVGSLRAKTKALGLSLGDRACLATASLLQVPVLTADRCWADLASHLDLDIRLIRPADR